MEDVETFGDIRLKFVAFHYNVHVDAVDEEAHYNGEVHLPGVVRHQT